MSEEFGGTALPAGWERRRGTRADPRPSQGGPHGRRGAGEHDGALRRGSLARLRGHVHGRPVPARRLRRGRSTTRRGRCSARAAERSPWACTRGQRRLAGRRRTRRSPASIRSSSTTTASSGRPPRSVTSSTAPWWPRMRSRSPRRCDRSPATSTRAAAACRSADLDLYSYPAAGTFTSRVFDAGDARATWRTLNAAADTPAGTGVSFEVRTGSTPTPDASWTAWQPVGAGGEIRARPGGATSSTGQR